MAEFEGYSRFPVVASGVTREDAEYYIGHNVTTPHPDPTLPLDYIELAERGPVHFELGGHRKNESWFVWRIGAVTSRSSRRRVLDPSPNSSFKR